MTEQIGKVVIDKRFYPDEDRYSDGDETEQKLLDIVSSCSDGHYAGAVASALSWPLLYHLSPVRENILNWLPLTPDQTVLELGSGCGAVTGAFLNRGAKVTAVDLSLRRSRINAKRHQGSEGLKIFVGAMETVLPNLTEQYDIVTLIGVLEYAAVFSDQPKPFHRMLTSAARAMKPDGSLWVAIENKLGLKYFAGCREDHTGRLFESLEGYPHRDGPVTFCKRELTDLADECGLDCAFWYPYPDYKFPVKIFSDEYLPRKGELTRNWQNFDAERAQLLDESAVFDSVIGAGLFPELSNSFLVQMKRKEAVRS
ncbi:MAG: class I SAM-dependent methyltransferase [Clostridiales bacterium]|nr:class I SAM-dependent methyltransferase [Clostridiales bacterium]